MHKGSVKYRALAVRSSAELRARDFSGIPSPSVALVHGPLAVAPSAQPDSQPAPPPTAGGGSTIAGIWNGPVSFHSASPTDGGGTPILPVSTVPSETFPAPTTETSPGALTSTSGPGTIAGSSSSSGGNILASSSRPTGPVTAAISVVLGASVPAALSTAFVSLPSSPLNSGSSTVTTRVSSPTPSAILATSSGLGLSRGSIAGTVVACLFSLLVLILLLIQRRSIARRLEMRRIWRSAHASSSGSFSLVNGRGDTSPSRRSSHSSFATHFDQGAMFRTGPPASFTPAALPDLPPMAEIRERNSVLVPGTAAHRDSSYSIRSNESDPGAQYVIASTSHNSLGPPTPMSVRPFSPSESFSFPKPPAPLPSNSFRNSGVQESVSCRSEPSGTLLDPANTPRAIVTELSPALIPSLCPPRSSPTDSTLPPPNTPVQALPDPFADPVQPEFADIEIIRRPFSPSLEDELRVYPGDRIRVLQSFDDGWAAVEKLADTDGLARASGLIPVDCLREAGQALPTFLSQKRVVSYVSDGSMALAL